MQTFSLPVAEASMGVDVARGNAIALYTGKCIGAFPSMVGC